LLFDLALQILNPKQGRPSTAAVSSLPMLLSVSLSANDYIGHLFGPDSWEAWDELRRLDQTLAWFFKELDRLRPQAWSVVLTADHGVARLDDGEKRPACGDDPKSALVAGAPCVRSAARGARIYTEEVKKVAGEAAAQLGLLGKGEAQFEKMVDGVIYPYIYLTDRARRAVLCDAKARARLASALDRELRKRFAGVHAVWDVEPFKDAPGECPLRKAQACPDEKTDLLKALVCHSISPKRERRGGDFYILAKPGAFFDPDLIPGKGVSHGSPYAYDRLVPLFVREPTRMQSARVTDQQPPPFTLFHEELVRIIQAGNTRGR
jgi:hypothetical protein